MRNTILLIISTLFVHLAAESFAAPATAEEIAAAEKASAELAAAAEAAAAKAKAAAAEAERLKQEAAQAANKAAEVKGTTAAENQAIKDNMAAEDLKGLGFGVGVGAVFDVGGSTRIKNASVDQAGIVRADTEDSVRVGAILETHYLWKWDSVGASAESKRFLFHGPQVSAILGDNIIDGVGVGYMVALRRRNVDGQSFALKSFNLGVGAMIQPDVQTLGDGLEKDEPLPAGDQLRYKHSPKPGVYVVFSVGF